MHTKGEWHWEGNIEPNEDKDHFYRSTAETWLSGENGEPVLVPWDCESYSCGLYISDANARLISAAPDLLEACKPFAQLADMIPAPDASTGEWEAFNTKVRNLPLGYFRNAKAAIDKATK